MGCTGDPKSEKQRTTTVDKTLSIQSREPIHSTKEPQADQSEESQLQPKRPRIKFPAAKEIATWKALDEELSTALKEEFGKSKYDHRLSKFGDTVYEICKQKFGVKELAAKLPNKKNRRQILIEDIRKKKRNLKRRLKSAPESEKPGLTQLWKQLKAKHNALSKAERLRKRRNARKKEQDRFFRDPFQYARQMFDQPRSGTLQVDKEILENHLHNTYSDQTRDTPLEHIQGLEWPDVPGREFEMKPPTLNEVRRVVKKAKCKSAPGPNGIPYLLYKRCPKVLRWLHNQLRLAWKENHVSSEWMKAEGVYIPKEQDSKELSQFRPISLLNVEGKIFFSVIASRITAYLIENGFIDTSVQKGGVPGVAGCLEHATMIWEAIQTAKKNKRNLDVIWLDLANAYGSVPHAMIQLALEMYHIPEEIKNMLKSYFHGFQMRFTTEEYTTSWIDLQVGIAMGCAVSPILFVMAMQVILKATEKHAKPANLGNGCEMSPLKAFMDDTTVLATKEEETRAILSRLEELISWSRMKFKPKKSRSLSLRTGKIKETHFHIGGQRIPTVTEEPVKSLGRWYDESLKDTNRAKETIKTLDDGLRIIDRCSLSGKYKIWCLQHMLLPKLLWPLLVYEIGITIVRTMETKINRYTRKWLGVPPCLTDVALYCRQAKLKLPFKSITEEYKCGKVRLQTMIENSEDDVVRSIQPTLKTGRKWKVQDSVDVAKGSLKLKEVIGYTQSGREGLGAHQVEWWSQADKKRSRDMILNEVRCDEDHKRYQKAVQQAQQGHWTTWEGSLQRSLTWNDIWNMAPMRLNFIIRSSYDTLPSRANLQKWGMTEDAKCPLCEKTQTTEHVLSSCKKALSEGRYTWRHNRVLEKLAEIIVSAFPQKAKEATGTYTQDFVKEGTGKYYYKVKTFNVNKEVSILSSATDWQIAGDLPDLAAYPEIIKQTGQRPDIVVYSESVKKINMIELTVPYETRIDEQHEFKLAKYEDLAVQVKKAGYAVTILAVEMGARGFVGVSMFNALTKLGLKGRKRRNAVKELAEITEKSSSWLWYRRNESRLMK